jgi:hypothetical protein
MVASVADRVSQRRETFTSQAVFHAGDYTCFAIT